MLLSEYFASGYLASGIWSVSNIQNASTDISLSVIVLAGGHSRRMGEDKALLSHQGQSLLSRTVQVAQQLSNDVLLVTPWPERYQATLPESVRYVVESTSVDSISLRQTHKERSQNTSHQPSQKPSAGPLSGFAQGWQQTSADWCLLLACDLPYLEADVLQQWWQWILTCELSEWPKRHTHPGASLVLSQFLSKTISSDTHSSDTKTGWQPLCGYYHRSCLASLNQQITTSQRSFQTWLSTLPIARYDTVPTQMLFNCNTPSDWARVISSNTLKPDSL